jgi:hypothetical protein
MRENRQTPGIVVLCTILVLAVVTYAHEVLWRFGFYRSLHQRHPFYIAESLDKLLGALLCCLAIYAMHRVGLRGITRELGLAAPILPAMTFAFLASSPTLIGFALTRKVAPDLSFPPLLFLTVFSPFVEELEFRGFGFWQLYRRARWPFWLAILPPAVLFGLGHIEKGQGWIEVAGIFLLTAAGSAVFSWVLDQWQSLWAPFGLHLLMNLWWDIFSVSNTTLGGWFPFALQTTTVALAILLTWQAKRRGLVPAREQHLL